MASSPVKRLRCAIYTRKSTEHGLDLEFNSLDAQREACEAYIKSQSFQGWQCLAARYDDPAYSGGNLDRPALQQLLKDIDAGRVDIVVVYKIDRLTRSLADFAKLVEAFDAKSISFVAVTQQFNTTTSMGRLTLNVLLSFAQFERELSSERVRDKVAASRRKGKWTGGTIPLGYDIANKKLVPNPVERKTIEYIFRKYLELKSSQQLIAHLDAKGIVTKRREAKQKKYQGGIPFTYGPLAYVLKNRIYLGEMSHHGKWYPGEHKPILDPDLFNNVQAILDSRKVARRARQTQSGAILMGKLFDDRGNKMSPSHSNKDGVRYHFYVSSALLKGRKGDAGSISRITAKPIETAVTAHIKTLCVDRLQADESFNDFFDRVLSRVDLRKNALRLTIQNDEHSGDGASNHAVDIPWTYAPTKRNRLSATEAGKSHSPALDAIVRAHAWMSLLENGTYCSIEELASAVKMNANVVRKCIAAAFLDPKITEGVLQGDDAASDLLAHRHNVGLHWNDQF
ncbi:MAG: recombinase family protein [Candidatus Afipia apatlaquensis]|uniref:Recombinase family protein n=1 Tax=Candidatus Afipia apatlaquensis TaxID=2712852 RepID=A0A7C9VMS2_9BRAD|nr:recombinase family protein [Candidatus Afipia apatlaquensis]